MVSFCDVVTVSNDIYVGREESILSVSVGTPSCEPVGGRKGTSSFPDSSSPVVAGDSSCVHVVCWNLVHLWEACCSAVGTVGNPLEGHPDSVEGDSLHYLFGQDNHYTPNSGAVEEVVLGTGRTCSCIL